MKPSDLRMRACLGGGTHSYRGFSNVRDKLNAQGTGLFSLLSCKSKSGLIYYYYMEVCSAVTHMVRVLQIFSAQAMNLPHVCTKLQFFCLLLQNWEKKDCSKQIHYQSLEADLGESNSSLQGSKSQLVRSEGRSSHKHLKIESPVGSSPTEI